MTVVILEDAAEDLESGAQSMNRARPELAITFSIQSFPILTLWFFLPVIYFGFHRMLSKRFPFGIYYEVEDDALYVYAILDLRRDPLWIRKRLRERR